MCCASILVWGGAVSSCHHMSQDFSGCLQNVSGSCRNPDPLKLHCRSVCFTLSGATNGRRASRTARAASTGRCGRRAGEGSGTTAGGMKSTLATAASASTETAPAESTGTTLSRWTHTTTQSHTLGECCTPFLHFWASPATLFQLFVATMHACLAWLKPAPRGRGGEKIIPCLQLPSSSLSLSPSHECRYELAVKHSPDLVNIPLRRPNQGPKQQQGDASINQGWAAASGGGGGSGADDLDDGGLGSGMDAL